MYLPISTHTGTRSYFNDSDIVCFPLKAAGSVEFFAALFIFKRFTGKKK